jgi:hypothetical protein
MELEKLTGAYVVIYTARLVTIFVHHSICCIEAHISQTRERWRREVPSPRVGQSPEGGLYSYEGYLQGGGRNGSRI